MIQTVLVANRGEIARRIMRTCANMGISTVAVHSDADADASHVREADFAIRLPGNSAADTYLHGARIIEAAHNAGADAVHPGYGFLSENAAFAREVTDAGLIWVGPGAETIEAMGSKTRAKELITAAGVPVLDVDPETAGPDDFPLLVKASAGGGGRGMRVVEEAGALQREMAAAAAEARTAFGDETVFVEPYLPTARHIEVQIMADTHGTIWVLGDRDCSVQRRHQKVIEEAPAPGVSAHVRTQLHEAAHAAAKAVHYIGAGTVEFLVTDAGDDGGKIYFLEMNTRLQVEHPVTELIYGLDLVETQLQVADGAALPEFDASPQGHAVEARIYAEDPRRDYQPQTGILRSFEFRPGPSVRVDAAVEAGSSVSPYYDAMLAKVIAHGSNRDEAIRRLSGALRTARVTGVITNIDLVRGIISSAEFAGADLHTGLLAQHIDRWARPPLTAEQRRAYAAAAALAQAARASENSPVQTGIPTAFRNVPSAPRRRRYEHDGQQIDIDYQSMRGRLTLSGENDLHVESVTSDGARLVTLGVSAAYAVDDGESVVDVHGPYGSVTLDVVPDFSDPAEQVAEGSLLAPMPGTVAAVHAEPGQRIAAGAPVVVVEAMKMQHTIGAPADGIVAEINVEPGAQVAAGAVLAVIDPEPADQAPEETP